MPELPEVETTVRGLHETVIGKTVAFVWSDLPQKDHSKKQEIKNLSFWNFFKKQIIGAKITEATRRGKNILITLSNGFTLLVHMKMTGHLMFGNYRKGKQSDGKQEHSWAWWGDTEHLQDPFNRFIHLVLRFTDETSLVFCDARKFGTVTLVKTENIHETKHLKDLGPDALDPHLTRKEFQARILKQKNKPIKSVLLDQTIITGIGNIYSDEMLWLAGIHPLRTPSSFSQSEWKKLWSSMKPVLEKGINFGGDSTSDYRNIYGKHGEFHHAHNAYRKTGKPCERKNCKGTIKRIVVGARSTHFCDTHQI